MRLNVFLPLCIILSVFLVPDLSNAARKGKLQVNAVIFEGNKVYSKRMLRKAMLTRPSGFLAKKYYYQEVLEEDLRNLERFYYNRGYLEAKIRDEVIIDQEDNTVRIRIIIDEGELTNVENISILGNNAFSDERILEFIKIKSGDAFEGKSLEEATKSILNLYGDNGYIDAEANTDVQVNPKIHKASIDFMIKENLQYSIAKINLKGVEKTKRKVIMRELLFQPGEIINYSKLLKSQRQLYLTGLFQKVFIKPQSAEGIEERKKGIVIDIKENLSIEMGVSVGYDTIDKFWQKFEINNTNLAGTARKIGFSAKRTSLMRKLETSFTEPWTFGYRWRTDLNLFGETREEPGYDLRRIGWRIAVGKAIYEHLNLLSAYKIEEVRLENIRVNTIITDSENIFHNYSISVINDSRNNLVNPTEGTYIEFSNELTSSKRLTFIRSIERFKCFYRWTESTVLASALEIGWISSSKELDIIPLSKRFYAGGPDSMRGFGYRLVGPLDGSGLPRGGKLKVVWNAIEVRRLLYKMFSLAIFTDIGNIWEEPEDLRVSEFRTCAGIGLWADIAIGIVRCDYGVNLDPKEGEARTQLFFSTGMAF